MQIALCTMRARYQEVYTPMLIIIIIMLLLVVVLVVVVIAVAQVLVVIISMETILITIIVTRMTIYIQYVHSNFEILCFTSPEIRA
jgi:hypothetical protein